MRKSIVASLLATGLTAWVASTPGAWAQEVCAKPIEHGPQKFEGKTKEEVESKVKTFTETQIRPSSADHLIQNVEVHYTTVTEETGRSVWDPNQTRIVTLPVKKYVKRIQFPMGFEERDGKPKRMRGSTGCPKFSQRNRVVPIFRGLFKTVEKDTGKTEQKTFKGKWVPGTVTRHLAVLTWEEVPKPKVAEEEYFKKVVVENTSTGQKPGPKKSAARKPSTGSTRPKADNTHVKKEIFFRKDANGKLVPIDPSKIPAGAKINSL